MSPIQLNVFALSNSHSLFISLTSPLILSQDHLNKILFHAHVNSKSTHCFVNSKFVDTHHLKTSATPPVALHLFNSSSNSTISEIANLLIIFSTSGCINLDFYITPLNSSCSLVLEYNWLTQHNLLIDWVRRELIDKGDNGGGMGEDDVYIGNGEEVVLALLSDSYSELDTISVSASRPSFCPILHHLLTTFNLRKKYMILV